MSLFFILLGWILSGHTLYIAFIFTCNFQVYSHIYLHSDNPGQSRHTFDIHWHHQHRQDPSSTENELMYDLLEHGTHQIKKKHTDIKKSINTSLLSPWFCLGRTWDDHHLIGKWSYCISDILWTLPTSLATRRRRNNHPKYMFLSVAIGPLR